MEPLEPLELLDLARVEPKRLRETCAMVGRASLLRQQQKEATARWPAPQDTEQKPSRASISGRMEQQEEEGVFAMLSPRSSDTATLLGCGTAQPMEAFEISMIVRFFFMSSELEFISQALRSKPPTSAQSRNFLILLKDRRAETRLLIWSGSHSSCLRTRLNSTSEVKPVAGESSL